MTRGTQEDQTLRMLRAAGTRGVHTFEMRQAFIGNPSERVARLERRGHRIRVGERERLNGRAVGVRYFLEYDAESERTLSETQEPGFSEQASPGSVPSPEGVRPAASAQPLFDTHEFAACGDYRDAEAA